MRILLITPLYPPLHAGTFDFRAHSWFEILSAKGHQVRVLTSHHGLQGVQIDDVVERRLRLNGVFGHERITDIRQVESLELHNHDALQDALLRTVPDIIFVWSLQGLSKSLIFRLYRASTPALYCVADDWLVQGIPEDPWLRWWNAPGTNLVRSAMELSRKRNRLDALAPTRLTRGYNRMPEVYGTAAETASARSVAGFRFDRLFFSSRHLRNKALSAGFAAADAPIIHNPVPQKLFHGQVKPADEPLRRLIAVGPFSEKSGLDTVISALKHLADGGVRLELTAYGRGDSHLIAALRSFVARHTLAVQFLSPADQARDLPGILRQHDALLYCHEEPEDTVPIPMQAMACGLTVVGTCQGAAADWIQPDETGLTFAPGDYVQLAFQLNRLVKHPELREKLARAGQESVASQAADRPVLERFEGLVQEAREIRMLQS